MKRRNHRLVLECVILATELARLVLRILVLLGTAINYSHEAKVDHQVRA